MKMRVVCAITAAAAVFMWSGCASIVGKQNYPVTITSTPDGADIVVKDSKGNTVHKAVTPTTVTLKSSNGYFSSEDYIVTFTKAGCAERIVKIRSSASGWYIFGNLFFGGIIGWLIVDPCTGAMWTLEEKVHADLGKPTSQVQQRVLKVVMLDQVPSELRPKLVRLR